MDIPLKPKYRTPKPKGANKSNPNGNSGHSARKSDALLKVLKAQAAEQRARQPKVVLHILPNGKRHFERTYPAAA